MSFTLFYDGPLKANARPREKHELRRHFHRQLKELLQRKPYEGFKRDLDQAVRVVRTPSSLGPPNPSYAVIGLGPFCFVPFISERRRNIARLHITLLVPEEPGRAITQSGDLDNRLKTLLDALRCPKIDEIRDETPAADEDPFYCLLEDDALISELSVTSDRLLRPNENRSHAVVLVRVIPVRTDPILGQWQLTPQRIFR